MPEVTLFILPSDGEAEDGEQGPVWTFPPTVRPSPHSKLHKGTALHGSHKVCPVLSSLGASSILTSESNDMGSARTRGPACAYLEPRQGAGGGVGDLDKLGVKFGTQGLNKELRVESAGGGGGVVPEPYGPWVQLFQR